MAKIIGYKGSMKDCSYIQEAAEHKLDKQNIEIEFTWWIEILEILLHTVNMSNSFITAYVV